jgi:flagellar biosynthesis/type III secretory pathway protein FliH
LNPVASALLPKMRMEKHDRPRVLLTSLRLLARLGLEAARRRFLSGFINTYLRLTKQDEAQFHAELAQLSPQEQERTMELTTSWKEEDILEGIQQGKQEGNQEEAFNLTQRFLTRRIGLIPPELEERMSKLSRLQLEHLFDAAYDFTSKR